MIGGAGLWLCRDRSVSFEEDAEEDDEVELEKSNVLLMGPTGSGMDLIRVKSGQP